MHHLRIASFALLTLTAGLACRAGSPAPASAARVTTQDCSDGSSTSCNPAQAPGGEGTCTSDCTPGKFVANEFWTTPYGPAAADVVLANSNFLTCQGNRYALCFYSGVAIDPPTANGNTLGCKMNEDGTAADCECAVFDDGVNYVSINSILDTEAYIETVRACGIDGSGCQNMTTTARDGSCTATDPSTCKQAPICGRLDPDGKGQTLYPTDADNPQAMVISTFSTETVNGDFKPTDITDCSGATAGQGPGPYVGCMTALCEVKEDKTAGTSWAECECPVFCGPFSVGRNEVACEPGDGVVWSAAYMAFDGPAMISCPGQ